MLQHRRYPMTPIAYVATVQEPEPGVFLVTFPDVPEAITQGATRAEAEANASDALSAALEGYLELGRDFPARDYRGEGLEVPVALWIAAPALLRREMVRQGLTGVALAARLGKNEKAVRRILSGRGASLGQALEALQAVGLRPALAV